MPREIERTGPGAYAIRLEPEARTLLRGLSGELRGLLGTEDPGLRRLFPPAYPDDAAAEKAYRSMTADEIFEGRFQSLAVLEETADAERLDQVQLEAWAGALNDLRLVLGTKLDVTEEMYEEPIDADDPRAGAFSLFAYLGWLQEQVVAALAAELDDAAVSRGEAGSP